MAKEKNLQIYVLKDGSEYAYDFNDPKRPVYVRDSGGAWIKRDSPAPHEGARYHYEYQDARGGGDQGSSESSSGPGAVGFLARVTAVVVVGGFVIGLIQDGKLPDFSPPEYEEPDVPSVPPAPVPGKFTPIWTGDANQCPTGTIYVESGDNLNALATRHNVEAGAILDANDIADPNMLIAGWCLDVP